MYQRLTAKANEGAAPWSGWVSAPCPSVCWLPSSLPSRAWGCASSRRSATNLASDGERGAAALETSVALAFLLVSVAVLAQFAVWQYARGAARSAAQEAARAASVDPAPGVCERRFNSVIDGLLAGPLGDQVGEPRCVVDGDVVSVTSTVRLERWLPISPDWTFDVEALAVLERSPGP
jgi:hypothetical protein